MRSPIAATLCLLLPLALGGCESLRDALGQTKKPPDEFQVVRQAPLTLPPDFSLRPPQPGAPRPQELQPREQAQSLLTGQRGVGRSGGSIVGRSNISVSQTQGEVALLSSARALDVDPNIRRTVNEEFAQIGGSDQGFLDRLLDFGSSPADPLVDPQKESQRLREATAAGRPPEGDAAVMQRRRRGLLEGIF